MLADEVQDDPAGHKYLQERYALEQGGNRGSRRHDLLEIIQHQQQLFVAQRVDQNIFQRLRSVFAEPQRRGNRRKYKLRITDGGQGDEPDAMRKGMR